MAKWMIFARRFKLAGRLEILLSVMALVAAVTTYVAMSRKSAPFEVASGQTIRVLLIVNLVLLMALGAAVGRWFVRMWLARKAGAPGSRLHMRVTSAFIVIASVPPVIMAIFSALFLEFGIQSWFSEKVRSTLNNSLEVAESYLIEHRYNIQKDLVAIGVAFNNLSTAQRQDPLTLQRVAETALSTRILSEVLVVQESSGEGRVLARANDNLELTTSRLKTDLLDRARRGETVVANNQADKTVIALKQLSGFLQPTYLYIARDLDPRTLTYLEATRSAVADYETMEGQRSNIQIQFNVVFIIVALLVLLAAIWIGLRFSSRLVTPLSNLVDAAERVGKGDLAVRVPHVPTGDEVGTLSRAFNRMTDQLARHQDALMHANTELDERRRFLEEVLEGVSAGVIGLQQDQTVFLPNRSACTLLGRSQEDLLGHKLGEEVPAFAPLLAEAENASDGTAQAQVQLEVNGEMRTLLARVSVERQADRATGGFVVTFDDLTDQLADQRTAAWADVARRIAHEIKNPLTPIHLSAERLKRKYGKEVESDPAVFAQCTDTIIRQVGDLRRMVDEFSSFARMPAPLFKETDIADVVSQAVFLQDVAWSDVTFVTQIPDHTRSIPVDGRLVGQALTNLMKNAAESVESRVARDKAADGDTVEPGRIRVTLTQDAGVTHIVVEDNGVGLPKEQKDRLMEPYVTTRVKGTGLGLAIVRRIMEEHGGRVRVSDLKPVGARAVLSFHHAVLERLGAAAEAESSAPAGDGGRAAE
ncbi:sensor histidine kinase NtrY-like [Yunchengibacter salinarum]|uniref:sensor histidine kinase NtrY-like n=1 Tax=Yunchengibacter salinarum TaxID=3133399 RepID=UPI0035B61012